MVIQRSCNYYLRTKLMHEQIDVNAKNKYGWTPLHHAAYDGHAAVVQALLASKADVNAKDEDGRTPLHKAAYNGHEEVVKLLLENRANARLENNLGQTPLALAKEHSKANVATILDNHSSAINSKLLAAVNNIDGSKVQQLLDEGADINAKDTDDNTPLHIAARFGCIPIIHTLLQNKKIQVNLKNKTGQAPLYLAAQNNYADAVKALLRAQGVVIVVNAVGADNYTSLHIAAERGHQNVVTALLTHSNIKVNLKNKTGQAPLHIAAIYGHAAVVQVLLNHGQIDVNEKDPDQQAPLHLAAENGHADAVKALLAHRDIKVNEKGFHGNTPLHLAAENGHADAVKALLAHLDIKVNEKGFHGNTPLHFAAASGRTAIVKLLLASKADVNALDTNGDTPVILATDPVIIQMLQDATRESNSRENTRSGGNTGSGRGSDSRGNTRSGGNTGSGRGSNSGNTENPQQGQCKEHYRTLGVPTNATINEINNAYRALARRHHPDKNLDDNDEATERFKVINAAYEVLSDTKKRERYDATRSNCVVC